jgi:hypothetical protein
MKWQKVIYYTDNCDTLTIYTTRSDFKRKQLISVILVIR